MQVHSLLHKNTEKSKMRSTLEVEDTNAKTHFCTFKLDTGAETNVLPHDVYKSMMLPSLKPTSTVLCGFGNTLITPLGSLDMAVYDRTGRRFVLMFHVTEVVDIPILGEHACELLNLVKKIDDIRG